MIPDSIKIGGYDIEVKLVDNLRTDRSAWGMYDPHQKTISLDPTLCDQQLFGTLIHEVLEAIIEIHDIEHLDEDHRALTQLAEGFHQVIKDNKEMFL